MENSRDIVNPPHMAGGPAGRRDSTGRRGTPGCPGCRTAGFTLLEPIIAMAVNAILAALAQSVYTQHMIKARNDRPMAELSEFQLSITTYYQNNAGTRKTSRIWASSAA